MSSKRNYYCKGAFKVISIPWLPHAVEKNILSSKQLKTHGGSPWLARCSNTQSQHSAYREFQAHLALLTANSQLPAWTCLSQGHSQQMPDTEHACHPSIKSHSGEIWKAVCQLWVGDLFKKVQKKKRVSYQQLKGCVE